MNPIFEKVYRQTVSPFRDELTELWNKHGGAWIKELSGGVCFDLDDVGTTMDAYRQFDEMSGEEQYAFAEWVKGEHPRDFKKLKEKAERSRKNEE